MKVKLICSLIVIVIVGACGRSARRAQQQYEYETVDEGSASGVTSTIHGPGETLPPITGTNADQTTAFAFDPDALPSTPTTTSVQPPGTIPPTTTSPPITSTRPPVVAVPRPHPVPPVERPPQRQPQPQPQPPPAETQPPPTDTTTTQPPPTETSTTTTTQPPPPPTHARNSGEPQ